MHQPSAQSDAFANDLVVEKQCSGISSNEKIVVEYSPAKPWIKITTVIKNGVEVEKFDNEILTHDTIFAPQNKAVQVAKDSFADIELVLIKKTDQDRSLAIVNGAFNCQAFYR